jgi:hypothetical protein
MLKVTITFEGISHGPPVLQLGHEYLTIDFLQVPHLIINVLQLGHLNSALFSPPTISVLHETHSFFTVIILKL